MVRVEKNGRAALDAEVPEKAKRRQFTAEYKLKILKQADACTPGSGELGELLRKEGLYSSHLLTWREQRDAGTLAGLTPKKRGRKAKRRDEVTEELGRLRRENARLQQRLVQAEAIIDVQKKLSIALGIDLPTPDKNGENE